MRFFTAQLLEIMVSELLNPDMCSKFSTSERLNGINQVHAHKYVVAVADAWHNNVGSMIQWNYPYTARSQYLGAKIQQPIISILRIL